MFSLTVIRGLSCMLKGVCACVYAPVRVLAELHRSLSTAL